MSTQNIPVRLRFLETNTADGFEPNLPAPVIPVRVDARARAQQLKVSLKLSGAWPKGLTREEIEGAIVGMFGVEVLRANLCPFPDVAPGVEPPDLWVREAPGGAGWLTIDREDGRALTIHGTRQQALCDAWDASSHEEARPERVYAYYAVQLDSPTDYEIGHPSSLGWVWATQDMQSLESFATEIEAKIAAWRHKLSQAEPVAVMPEFIAGKRLSLDETQIPTAIIHRMGDRPQRHAVRCIGGTQMEAEALRDQVLGALNAPRANAAAEEVRYPMQPIGLDPHGRPRFEKNPIVEYLACAVSDLNHLAVWCAENAVDPRYQEQLAQLIGYSVDGYGSLSYVSDDSYERAAVQAERLVAGRKETRVDG